jgi:hypothetical protein
MPYYLATPQPLLVEADNPVEAAKAAYRIFEDSSPNEFRIIGPDHEVSEIALSAEEQEEAITVAFATSRNPA